MGQLTETTNDLDPISRVEQDTFAARSHQRAAAATAAGVFKAEIEPVVVPGRRGDVVVDTDEGIRADTTVESLGKLRPAFRKDGTITAGTSSQISDGAAAVIVMAKDEAERRGLDWIAEIGAHGMIAGPDSSLQDKPARAIRAACEKAGIEPADLDLVEINEAFAAVGHRLHPLARDQRGHRQRQRRRDRPGSPDRHVRRPDRPAPRAWNCSDAAAAPASPRSAAAADRATRCC